MASQILDVLKNGGTHEVGSMNSWKARTLANGAIVADANIDNFTFVELGFNEEGERICKQLSDVKKDTYLIDGVERRTDYEGLSSYYNAIDERSRIWILDKGLRFQTSAYSLNTGVKEIKNGLVAHFDPTTKKYIISDPASPHADYTTADKKLLVVNTDNEIEYLDNKEIVRFEIQ